jgi:hypothetical protein
MSAEPEPSDVEHIIPDPTEGRLWLVEREKRRKLRAKKKQRAK